MEATGAEPVETILRNEFYQRGEDTQRVAGMLIRVAPSFLRFGSVQLAAVRQGPGGVAQVTKQALRYISEMESADDSSAVALFAKAVGQSIDTGSRERCFFGRRRQPSCAAEFESLAPKAAMACLLRRVTARTAALFAAWQSVGFAHGVLNTDNMSLVHRGINT